MHIDKRKREVQALLTLSLKFIKAIGLDYVVGIGPEGEIDTVRLRDRGQLVAEYYATDCGLLPAQVLDELLKCRWLPFTDRHGEKVEISYRGGIK